MEPRIYLFTLKSPVKFLWIHINKVSFYTPLGYAPGHEMNRIKCHRGLPWQRRRLGVESFERPSLQNQFLNLFRLKIWIPLDSSLLSHTSGEETLVPWPCVCKTYLRSVIHTLCRRKTAASKPFYLAICLQNEEAKWKLIDKVDNTAGELYWVVIGF